MAKKKEKSPEKIIEYGPKTQSGSRRGRAIIAFAFIATWAIMIYGGLYVNKKLHSELSPGGMNNADLDTVKQRLHELEGGKGLVKEVQRKLMALEQEKTDISQQIKLNKEEIYKIRMKEGVGETETGDLTGFLPEELPPAGSATEVAALHKEEVKNLKERVEKLEEQKKGEEKLQLDSTLSPLLLSILNLRERIQKSMPYEADLKIVKELSGNDAKMNKIITTLEKHLSEGVVGISDLREEFETLAGRIVNISRKPENDTMLASAKVMFYRTFSVRKVGADVEGNSTEAIVARAEAKLKYGNLTKAVEELKKLEGEPSGVISEWMKKAERLLGVEDVFASMYERITKLSEKL